MNPYCFLLDGKTNLPIDRKNSNEKFLIPSINLIVDSQLKENNRSPSAITIIIKPFASSENHRKDTSIHKKSSSKKRKNPSLSSLESRTATCLSDHVRLSTFKDPIRSNPAIINFNENTSNNLLLHPRTLFNIYHNKKRNVFHQ